MLNNNGCEQNCWRAYFKQRFIHHSSHLVHQRSVQTIQSLPLVIWRITNYSVRCSNQAETQKKNGMEQKSTRNGAEEYSHEGTSRGAPYSRVRGTTLLHLLLRQELLGVAQPHSCLFLQSEETVSS